MHLYWKIRNGLYSNSPAMSMHIVWNIFYKFDCKWLHDIFVNLCMTIHIIVCSLWYRLYILLLSICWNLLINGWELWRNFESNVSLWVKGCEVTFHRDQVSYCYVWKWTLKKLPLFWLIYMFVYKMRLFMNDVLFIMLTQIIDND